MKFSIDEILQKGIKAHKAGQVQDAEQLYRSILQQQPNHPDANHNLGVLTLSLAKPELSLPYFKAALEANPQQSQFWLSMIDALIKVGEFGNASKLLQQGRNKGLKGKKLDQLARQLEKAQPVSLSSADAPTQEQVDALIALHRQGQFEEVVKKAESLIGQYPESTLLHNILGAANSGLGRLDEAMTNFKHAVGINPDYAEAHNHLGVVQKSKGDLTAAIGSYTRSIEINPDYTQAHFNLGNALRATVDLGAAIESYQRAVKINPRYTGAHTNLGRVLIEAGDLEGAIRSFKQALKIKPDYAEGHYNLGIALNQKGELGAAIKSHKQALKIKPDYASALAHKLHDQALICDWGALENERDLIPGLGVSTDFVTPFAPLYLEDHLARHQQRSKLFAQHQCKGLSTVLPALARPSKQPKRLRIGYFGANFHVHAVMLLIVRMFELHDRSTIETHAFSFGPVLYDHIRKRLEKGFDAFHDVHEIPDQDVAKLARSKGIDIAVDLTGYTKHGRWGILAYRAAPIQVSYLGYPGSMGADFIDYIIADHTLIPEQSQKFYSEKIVYMPQCYQISDNSRQTSDTNVTRTDLGLPEAGFVFCCFNTNLKITPREFDIWMRLLGKVEGSVLWLHRSNKWSEANLKKEAQARDVDSDRLVFAEKCDYSEYLMRLTKADLFLDTFNFNAGAIANDALWCGLPVITLQGQSYAARMASSLLTAADLPELITTSEDDYEQLALDLATHPKKLKSINARLNTKRNSPLFDTERFTKDIEMAYRRMYDRYFAGEKPAHLFIDNLETHQLHVMSPSLTDATMNSH